MHLLTVAGGLAYVAGQIARERDGTPAVTRGLVEHVGRALVNLDALLADVDLERHDVVWVEHHVADDPETVAHEHPRWFDPGRTAGVIVPVDGLYDPAYRVEITTIATTRSPHVNRTALPGEPGAPFARAVRAGPHVFVSAQHGLPDDGAADGVVAQFARALDRVLAAVRELGGAPEDVVATHIHTARELDGTELAGLADAHRARFVGPDLPTANLLGLRRVGTRGALVEVNAMAVLDEARAPQPRSSP